MCIRDRFNRARLTSPPERPPRAEAVLTCCLLFCCKLDYGSTRKGAIVGHSILCGRGGQTGKNSASGVGITPGLADQMFRAGADVITTGNHVWKRREIYPYIDQTSVLLRPYNYLSSTPGRGLVVVDTEAGRLGVVSLSGLLYMEPARSPFEAVEEALSELHGVRHVLVDFHAEATSEKVAMGHHLDGRVSGVIGTHTHVRTADARVLPQGTAYITDAGMCGAR